jgi:hypothetical protein
MIVVGGLSGEKWLDLIRFARETGENGKDILILDL